MVGNKAVKRELGLMLEEPCLRLQELPWQVFQRCDFINAFPIRSARLLPEKTVVARRARAFPGCLSKGGIECFLALNGSAPVRLLRCSYVSCAAVRVRSPQVRSVRSARFRESKISLRLGCLC